MPNGISWADVGHLYLANILTTSENETIARVGKHDMCFHYFISTVVSNVEYRFRQTQHNGGYGKSSCHAAISYYLCSQSCSELALASRLGSTSEELSARPAYCMVLCYSATRCTDSTLSYNLHYALILRTNFLCAYNMLSSD